MGQIPTFGKYFILRRSFQNAPRRLEEEETNLGDYRQEEVMSTMTETNPNPEPYRFIQVKGKDGSFVSSNDLQDDGKLILETINKSANLP
jgi:hypothetical protein